MTTSEPRQVFDYIDHWYAAARLQIERVANAVDHGDFHAEALLLLVAAQSVARAARTVAPEAAAAFEAEVPSLGPFRNTVEHFEDYATGRGYRQDRKGGSDIGTLMLQSGTVVRAANAVPDFVIHLTLSENGTYVQHRVHRHRIEPALEELQAAVLAVADDL